MSAQISTPVECGECGQDCAKHLVLDYGPCCAESYIRGLSTQEQIGFAAGNSDIGHGDFLDILRGALGLSPYRKGL